MASISNQGKALFAWNGSEWIPLNGGTNFSTIQRWSKIFEGGETSISGNDSQDNLLVYTPGYEQVYLNGILLVRNEDYTATDGVEINLSSPLAEDDVIDIIIFIPLNIGNTYTRQQSDARYVTITGLENEINGILDNAPEALNTLNELSAALNDDPNFYTTIASVYQKMIPYSATAPEDPNQGDLWVDSSTTPPALKVYDGSNWSQLGAAVDDSQAIIASRMFA